MVPLASLWLPIVVSAVLVFLASWIIHMFLPNHRRDFTKLPNEDAVLDALRSMNIPSGQYLAPYANTAAQMKQPEYAEKRKRGPMFFLTLVAGGDSGMGKSLLAVVRLPAGDFAVHRVPGAPRRLRRHTLPVGVQVRGACRLHGVCHGTCASIDLVPAGVANDRGLSHRWFDLFTVDRGSLRLFLAAVA